MRTDDPLAERDSISVEDLIGLPLFCSDQAWEADIKTWAKSHFSQLNLEGSFRLSYNGSVFAREGLGYLLTFDHLIDVSIDSGLVFVPLSPALKSSLYLAWNRYQAFTPIADRFLQKLKTSFAED
jgi:DNA-binding transcriptional LysR family regulator